MRSRPLENVAPRLICARYTVCSSKVNWGRKRRAMPIIMDSSCAGTPMRLKGCSRYSNASVMSSVAVVRVSRLIPSSNSSRRQAMKAACHRPASLMRMIHHSNSTVPPCTKNTLSRAVTTTMNASGAMDLNAERMGMPASLKKPNTNAAHTASPRNDCATNTTAMSASASSSFARASMRCSGLVPGQ